MKVSLIKKGLAVGVILLFIGLAFAPSINANISKPSLEKETVEFTTEVCGLSGGKQTVELTKAEAEEVEALFDYIRAKLNNTETRDEAEEVFKEAVVELDKYGLLGRLSVKQAQRLVTGGYQNSRVIKALEKMSDRHKGIFNNSNFLCLLAGETTNTVIANPVTIGSAIHSSLIILRFIIFFEIYPKTNISFPFIVLGAFLLFRGIFWLSVGAFSYFFPLKIGGFMTFGEDYSIGGGHIVEHPAKGWVYTLGLMGIKTWDGSLYGDISKILIPMYGDLYLGGVGFTGIRIYTHAGQFYLGSALRIKISDNHP